ncbi:MAG: hypothetical protein WCA00_04235 [Candidatus Acidiferrales bacterium]
MNQLADKIASEISPTHSLTVELRENSSSISAAGATALVQSLSRALAQHNFRVIQAEEPETMIYLTISDATNGAIFTADIRRNYQDNAEPLTAIVALPGSVAMTSAQSAAPLILQRKSVFAQRDRFLDFMLPGASSGTEGRLVLLQPDQVDYFRTEQTRWVRDKSIQVHSRFHVSRDPRGLIAMDDEGIHVYLPQDTCSGSGDGQTDLVCSPNVRVKSPYTYSLARSWPVFGEKSLAAFAPYAFDRNYFVQLAAGFGDVGVNLPAFYSGAAQGKNQKWILAELDGNARLYDEGPTPAATFSNWGDSIISVEAGCDPAWLLLVTGNGDWTVRDTIRIYEVTDHQAVTIGQPLEFPGPILALWPADDGKSARVVSRNLQTGMYEASIVSVSCGN